MARAIRLVLREGLRRHDVTVAIDGREVYRRPGAVTDGTRWRPETIDVLSRKRIVRVTLVATPGDLVASVDVDVETYAIVAIDLVGTATVSFETRARAHELAVRSAVSGDGTFDGRENGRVT